ncbi:MAG: hypothetical protein GFH27_549279n116 [Chloroflexi bacterium AL-W]|nr:hypothetical protein [Chloroflexi bacterium AL-N1]NOK65082.1 hypothetical protein [Chloroflexi bacterium AL-N10]NOK72651.1 hypothetical protein [Chloroflexi bacterium AL-N5]NOK79261.1 hypothetical protein [Chloroflexi bacterium AL-W]NOK87177.1 hypothetical protein [Chloroflexi bacterium AL-N15]
MTQHDHNALSESAATINRLRGVRIRILDETWKEGVTLCNQLLSLLLTTVDALVKTASINCFVETGSFCGVTLHHMATSYQLPCYSCEPDPTRFQLTQERLAAQPQAVGTNEESPGMLR